ncbi:MAG: hypothetical protein AAGF20_09735, partial [Pseudomonadota bacterium]
MPETQSYEFSGLKTFALPDEALGTLSARYENNETNLLTGISAVDAAQLRQTIDTETLDLGLTINSKLAANTWSALASYQQVDRSFVNSGSSGQGFAAVETTSRLGKIDL